MEQISIIEKNKQEYFNQHPMTQIFMKSHSESSIMGADTIFRVSNGNGQSRQFPFHGSRFAIQ